MDTRDRRGQLLLVAGLGLAVAFVVLALVLNAVVFTENLATRNHSPTDGVVGHERAVERGVGGLLAQTNYHENSDYGTLRAALRDGIAAWDVDAATLSVADGHLAAASLAGVENGTQVVQSTRRSFTNASTANTSSAADWTAAAGVNETRRFGMVVTPDDAGSPLTVTVSNGSASWRVAVAENDTNDGHTDVEVTDETGAVLADDTVESGTVELDVTEGTVNGTAVENWTYAEGVGAPYDVSFANGADAEGRYVFVVDRPRAPLLDALPEGTYHERDAGASPTTAPALYRATVDVTVRTSRVTYETTLPVAPESLPGDEEYAVGGDSA